MTEVIDKTLWLIAGKLAGFCGHPWDSENLRLVSLKYSEGKTKWRVHGTGVSISVGDCEIWVRRHDCKIEDLTLTTCEIDDLQRCVSMAYEVRKVLLPDSVSEISNERAKCISELRSRASEIRREHLAATGDVFDVNMMAAAYTAAAEYLESRTEKS